MAAWGYEFYFLALKVSLTRERHFQHSKIKFVSPRSHVISCIYINNIGDYSNRVNWKIIQSQRYLKTIDSQVFFCKKATEIQGSTMHVIIQPLKTF